HNVGEAVCEAGQICKGCISEAAVGVEDERALRRAGYPERGERVVVHIRVIPQHARRRYVQRYVEQAHRISIVVRNRRVIRGSVGCRWRNGRVGRWNRCAGWRYRRVGCRWSTGRGAGWWVGGAGWRIGGGGW